MAAFITPNINLKPYNFIHPIIHVPFIANLKQGANMSEELGYYFHSHGDNLPDSGLYFFMMQN